MNRSSAPSIPPPVPTDPPQQACDVIMKGGITSGVVYPWALAEFARTYRLHALGGASAGAIGAALGAAAEFGRSQNGFQVLLNLPGELGDGKLGALFQPQRNTRALLRVLLAATGHDRPGAGRGSVGKVLAVLAALVVGFPVAIILGALPGACLVVWGISTGNGWLVAAAAVLVLIGIALAAVLRLGWMLTRTVPRNLFGICRGTAVDGQDGFTDWLSDKIDAAAGLPPRKRPLSFGQLWADPDPERAIELRMITTCVSQGKPYELPLQSYEFFYDPDEWATLFPEYVMQALKGAPPARPENATVSENSDFAGDEAAAKANQPSLLRLPSPADLPVIVATRLSLSFPLLISAVPMWIVEHRSGGTRFRKHWFTDGGFCSNFPIHLFDVALPSRPTFAINLGTMGKTWEPSLDQRENLRFVTSNSDGLSLPYQQIPDHGLAAIAGFAVAAVNTSRNWPDNSYLRYPGHRDRTVLVKQSKAEGGLNLFMSADVIASLADRGREAANVMVERYTTPQFPKKGEREKTFTAWENHRWTRYRALVGALPGFLSGYANGRAAFDLNPATQSSYGLSGPDQNLAEAILGKFDEAATIAASADPKAIVRLADEPRPRAVVRRIPQI